jgi:hypothetical protein
MCEAKPIVSRMGSTMHQFARNMRLISRAEFLYKDNNVNIVLLILVFIDVMQLFLIHA